LRLGLRGYSDRLTLRRLFDTVAASIEKRLQRARRFRSGDRVIVAPASFLPSRGADFSACFNSVNARLVETHIYFVAMRKPLVLN
jgi:hypothetical protein